MKTHAWFGIAMLVVALALAIGFGLAQASSKQGATASAQANPGWFKDYVDQTGDTGTHPSIAFDPGNGTPWISYYDVTSTALKVAHYVGSSGNCGPDNTWNCETVDNAASVGTYSSIDVHPNTAPWPFDTWRVGVAYYDATNGALKFAEYACVLQTCAWNIVTVQDASAYIGAPNYGRYASMKYNAAGDPLIAYYVSSIAGGWLNYAFQVTSGGDCGEGSAAGLWECDTVDSVNNVGKYASLDYTDFAGVNIAYYDGNAGDLKYAYYAGFGNCGTGNAWYCITLDGTDGSDVGKFVSFHAPANSADELQFAYYDASQGELKYAVHVDGGSGNCGPGNSFQCDDIESIGTGLAQAGISLAVDSANVPLIAYMDASEALGPSNLKVAQPAHGLGLSFGNCGPEIPFATWQCTAIDNGGAYQEEADYASVAFAPGGLAMIAYSELDTYAYPNEYALKIAYQRVMVFLPVVIK